MTFWLEDQGEFRRGIPFSDVNSSVETVIMSKEFGLKSERIIHCGYTIYP